MNYQKYTIPPIDGVTMAFGGGTQQPIWDGVLSYKDAAQALATAIGATLVNAATTPSLGGKFTGLAMVDDPQPWVVVFPSGAWFFAGVSINEQVKINGGTIGNPGTWEPQAGGALLWVPTPPVVAPPAPAPAPNPADVATWANDVMNAGQGYQDADRKTLLDTHRLIAALAAKEGTS